MAVGYKMVFNKTVALDAQKKVKVQLFQEDKDYDISHGAKVKIKGMEGEKLFSFFDNNSNFPIYYLEELKLNKKVKNQNLVDLKSAVTVLDMDGNGKNEIIIYGEHYNTMIEHGTGNLLVLEENGKKIEQKMPIVLGYDSHGMKFYPKEKLLIVGQSEIDTEKSDQFLYQFYIYDMKNPLKKIPILLTKKLINPNDKKIIDKNLPKILARYHAYKKGAVSKVKEINLIDFVKTYWDTIADGYDFEFIEEHLKDEVFYYSKNISKKTFLTKKKDALKKIDSIKFELSNFLVYSKDGKYHIEYKKHSDIQINKDKSKYSSVKSLMVIDEVDGKFMIEREKDLRVLFK